MWLPKPAIITVYSTVSVTARFETLTANLGLFSTMEYLKKVLLGDCDSDEQPDIAIEPILVVMLPFSVSAVVTVSSLS